ncbi:MAG: hypothetical protein JW709_14290, partial [Sedimentisphaerales bacterium]|nr:hypothetical protein [Sedimentisphaerales bacterium]
MVAGIIDHARQRIGRPIGECLVGHAHQDKGPDQQSRNRPADGLIKQDAMAIPAHIAITAVTATAANHNNRNAQAAEDGQTGNRQRRTAAAKEGVKALAGPVR